jgi:hypothetical protein
MPLGLWTVLIGCPELFTGGEESEATLSPQPPVNNSDARAAHPMTTPHLILFILLRGGLAACSGPLSLGLNTPRLTEGFHLGGAVWFPGLWIAARRPEQGATFVPAPLQKKTQWPSAHQLRLDSVILFPPHPPGITACPGRRMDGPNVRRLSADFRPRVAALARKRMLRSFRSLLLRSGLTNHYKEFARWGQAVSHSLVKKKFSYESTCSLQPIG